MEVLQNLLSNNKGVNQIDLEFQNLDDITHLLLVLAEFPNLEILNVSNNNISKLPEDLSTLSALKSLDISNNTLTVEDAIPSLQTLPTLQVLYISLNTHNEIDLLTFHLPNLQYLNGEPVAILTPRPDDSIENNSFTDYELKEVAGLYDKVRELWRDGGYDYDANLVDGFDVKIKAILDDLTTSIQDRDKVQINGNILMAKYSMYKFVIDKTIEFLQCTEHRAAEILNHGVEVIDSTIGDVIGLFTYLPTPNTYRKKESVLDKETAEVLEAAELLEEELVAQKQENSEMKKELEELKIEMEAVQEENKKYLDMIIKQSKANADSALSSNTSLLSYSQKSATFARSSSKLQVNMNGQGRVLTLKQLKDTIEEIYTSKIKYDLKCTEGKMPRETMQQFLWTFLNQKYGLKNLTLDWATGIKHALQKYAPEDNDIAVFLKIFNNECDEEYRFVQTQVKETVAELLKVLYIQMHLRSKFPLKNNGEIQEMLTEKFNNLINEEEWMDIVQYMYNETDSDIITFQIRELIKKKYCPQTTIKKKQRLSREEMQLQKEREKAAKGRIAYKDFIKILLDYQLKGHEKFLEKFLGLYRELDLDKDAILDEYQFRELIASMEIDMTKDDIVRLLQIVDPFNHQKITFSDCVNLFSSVRDIQEHVPLTYSPEKLVSVLQKLSLES